MSFGSYVLPGNSHYCCTPPVITKINDYDLGGDDGEAGEGGEGGDDGEAGEGGEGGDDGEAGEGGEGGEEAADREAELRRMTADEVAAAIRSGEMVMHVHKGTSLLDDLFPLVGNSLPVLQKYDLFV